MPQTASSSLAPGHGIHLVDAHYLRNRMAAVYLLQQGRNVAIIETGTARSVETILQSLKDCHLGPDDVNYIIPTHVHLDHAGGAGLLMQHCRQARLVIHPYGARHMIDPARLIAGAMAVYGQQQFQALYGTVTAVDADRVIEAPDNFELDFNGRILRFLDTPGHARHHFCIHDTQSNGIFSGDTFGLRYPELDTPQGPFLFATTTPVQFDPEAMLQSIDRLLSLAPERFYLTHYGCLPVTDDLAEQLNNSIDAFTAIALEEQTPVENRITRIQQRLQEWLLEQLSRRGCRLATDACLELLKTDIALNAQGLDVWLNKMS